LAYKASDGKWYSHKETPSEYRVRKGIGSLRPDKVGCGFLLLMVFVLMFVAEYWKLVIGVALVGAVAYALQKSISNAVFNMKKKTWTCPKCSMTIERTTDEKYMMASSSSQCPKCGLIVTELTSSQL